MERYVTKTEIVHAQQFFPHEENWPEDVVDISNELIDEGFGLLTTNVLYFIDPNDWVVVDSEGNKFVMKDVDFKEKYKQIGG